MLGSALAVIDPAEIDRKYLIKTSARTHLQESQTFVGEKHSDEHLSRL